MTWAAGAIRVREPPSLDKQADAARDAWALLRAQLVDDEEGYRTVLTGLGLPPDARVRTVINMLTGWQIAFFQRIGMSEDDILSMIKVEQEV